MNLGTIAVILADAARRGIILQAHAGKLRFRPRSAMTSDLSERIKAHAPELLALLAEPATDTTPPSDMPTVPVDAESGVSSVVSVSERGRPSLGRWSEDELAMLARTGTTPAELPLVSAAKDAFAGFSATVVSVATAYGRGGWTRRRAADLIRRARLLRTGQALAMRDAWRERLAVCTIDGGMTEDHAEQVALDELEEYTLL